MSLPSLALPGLSAAKSASSVVLGLLKEDKAGYGQLSEAVRGCAFEALASHMTTLQSNSVTKLVSFCLQGMKEGARAKTNDCALFASLGEVVRSSLAVLDETPTDGHYDCTVEYLHTLLMDVLPAAVSVQDEARVGVVVACLESLLACMRTAVHAYSNKKKLFQHGTRAVLPSMCNWALACKSALLEADAGARDRVGALLDGILTESFFGAAKYVEELGRFSSASAAYVVSAASVAGTEAKVQASKSIYAEFFESVCVVALSHGATSIPARLLRLYAARAEELAATTDKSRSGQVADVEMASAVQRRQGVCALLRVTLALMEALCAPGHDATVLDQLVARNTLLLALSQQLRGALPNHESMLEFTRQLQHVSVGDVTALLQDEPEGDASGWVMMMASRLDSLGLLLEIDHRVVLESPDAEDGPLGQFGSVMSAIVKTSASTAAVADRVNALFAKVVTTMGRLRRMHDCMHGLVKVARDEDVATFNLVSTPSNVVVIRHELALLPSTQVAMCWPAMFNKVFNGEEGGGDDDQKASTGKGGGEVGDRKDAAEEADVPTSEELNLDAVKTQTVLTSVILSLPIFNHDSAPPYMMYLMDVCTTVMKRDQRSSSSVDDAYKHVLLQDAVLLATHIMGAAAKVIVDTKNIQAWSNFIKNAQSIAVGPLCVGLMSGCSGSNGSGGGGSTGTSSSSSSKKKRSRAVAMGSTDSSEGATDVATMVLAGYSLLFNVSASWSHMQGLLVHKHGEAEGGDEAWTVSHADVLTTLSRIAGAPWSESGGVMEYSATFRKLDLLLSSVPVWVGAARHSPLPETLATAVAAVFGAHEGVPVSLFAAFNFCGACLLANGMDGFLKDVVRAIVSSQVESAADGPLGAGFLSFFQGVSPAILRAVADVLVTELLELQRALFGRAHTTSSKRPTKKSKANATNASDAGDNTGVLVDLDIVANLLCGSVEDIRGGGATAALAVPLDVLQDCLLATVDTMNAHADALSLLPWTCCAASTLTHTLVDIGVTGDTKEVMVDALAQADKHPCTLHSAVSAISGRSLGPCVRAALSDYVRAAIAGDDSIAGDSLKTAAMLNLYCIDADKNGGGGDNDMEDGEESATVPEAWLMPASLVSMPCGQWWYLLAAQMRARLVDGYGLEGPAAACLVDALMYAVSVLTPEDALGDNAVHMEECARSVFEVLSTEAVIILIQKLGEWFDTEALDHSLTALNAFYAVVKEAARWIGRTRHTESLTLMGRSFGSIPVRLSLWLRTSSASPGEYFNVLLALNTATSAVLTHVCGSNRKSNKSDEADAIWLKTCLHMVGQVAQLMTKAGGNTVGADCGACVAVCRSCFCLVERMVGNLVSVDMARSLSCLTGTIQVLLCTLGSCKDDGSDGVLQKALASTYSKASYVIGLIAHNHATAKLAPTIMSSLIHCISDLEREQDTSIPESLLPGVLNLYDTLSSRERKQVFNSLDVASRTTLTALQDTWKKDYLFTGKA